MGKKNPALKQFIKSNYDYNLYCFKEYFDKIVSESGISKTDEFLQHGTTSRYLHSLSVAYYSYLLSIFIGNKANLKDIIRGGLAHDYFLYDSKVKDPQRHGHGKNHPKIALENAEKDFSLTDIERDIILKHMFPLTLTPPKYKESVIVSLVDKACAVYEFFVRKNPYPTLRHGLLGEEFKENGQLLLQALAQKE